MKKITLAFLLASTASIASLPDNYETLSAEKKHDLLLHEISTDAYVSDIKSTTTAKVLCPLKYGFAQTHKLLAPWWLTPRFEYSSDEMPSEDRGELKAIHTYGTVFDVEWVALPNPYTGIFARGGIGFLRASLARPYDGGSYTPGLALKILVDGKASVNFHAMNSLNGQDKDFNYFSKPFSNVIPEPDQFAQEVVETFSFNTAIHHLMDNGPLKASELPLDEAAAVLGSKWRAPYQIVFTPTAYANSLIDVNDPESDVRKQLAKITFDTRQAIYLISARETASGRLTPIGHIFVKGQPIASSYGDTILFFKHQKRIPRS